MRDYIIEPGTVIEVTDEHINEGEGSVCLSCAVSLAIREKAKGASVYTGVGIHISIGKDKRQAFSTPDAVATFMVVFDAWSASPTAPRPEPFSFVVPEPL